MRLRQHDRSCRTTRQVHVAALRLQPCAGKTLTVRAVVLAEAARLGAGAAGGRDAAPAPALVYINCMSLDGNSLLTRVAEGLQRNMHRTPKQAGTTLTAVPYRH
jgi:hypothetical protein